MATKWEDYGVDVLDRAAAALEFLDVLRREARVVAPAPTSDLVQDGLSGPQIDDIADRMRRAAKNGDAARLSDINQLCAHLHSTAEYNSLHQSASVNNALALDLLAENARLKADLEELEAIRREALEALEAFLPCAPAVNEPNTRQRSQERWFKALSSLPDDKVFTWAEGDLYEWQITMADLRRAAALHAKLKGE